MEQVEETLVSEELEIILKKKIGEKTKPPGSLGRLEQLALRIGLIQGTSNPVLSNPAMLVFAGDHGITEAGVSPYPREVTAQMVLNFLSGGAAINVFCRQHNIKLRVVDAGVAADFAENPLLVDAKVRKGTSNFLETTAMTAAECRLCLERGEQLAHELPGKDCKVIGFGEMGIGNTSSSSMLIHRVTGLPLESCVGRGTGLDDEGLSRKLGLLEKASRAHPGSRKPFEILSAFGGFEIAMMCGAMTASARMERILLIDGFIASAAFLLAQELSPPMIDNAIFTHVSGEKGHRALLNHLGAQALLDLDLRLGEGTGAALAYPLLESAVRFLNEMASFETAGVSDRTDV